jgi:tetratricopeptide (TPR) repeat protein
MPRALQYLERAQKLEPNAESVLVAQSTVLDFQLQELDYRRVRTELRATGQKLIDLYPNNYIGYFRLGVLARNEQRFEDAAGHFAKTIHLNPRWRSIKTLYWNMAYSTIYAGRDREGLDWVDRTMGAEGSLPAFRSVYLNMLRAVAYARTGNLEAAKRIIKQVTDQ